MANYFGLFPWVHLPWAIVSVYPLVRLSNVGIAQATRGTQGLIWEVPRFGNTRPRVYTPGYLPTVNRCHVHKLSNFTSSIKWTTSLVTAAHNSSNLSFGFNQSFAKSNKLSNLVGTIGLTSSASFAPYILTYLLRSEPSRLIQAILVSDTIIISQDQTTLANSRAPKDGHQARVSSRTKIATLQALLNQQVHISSQSKSVSSTQWTLYTMPVIINKPNEIANQTKYKLSKIQPRNYSLPKRHFVTCLQGKVYALWSGFTFKILLLASTKPKLQRSNYSARVLPE